jgi:single-strand selective monofunctional uracil DNA glycosylase
VLEGGLVDGAFARGVRIEQILHPSPASPAANRGWADAVDAKLAVLGLAPQGAASLR